MNLNSIDWSWEIFLRIHIPQPPWSSAKQEIFFNWGSQRVDVSSYHKAAMGVQKGAWQAKFWWVCLYLLKDVVLKSWEEGDVSTTAEKLHL